MSMTFGDLIFDHRFVQQAILGARLSYGNLGKSDSVMRTAVNGERVLEIGAEDYRFICARLASGVHGEDKFMRTIPFSVVITAPLKWWIELDTYKVGTTKQSGSLMHRLASKGEFTIEDFDVQDPEDPDFLTVLRILNRRYQRWLDSGARRHDTSPEWRGWQDLIPRSYRYTAQWTGNYATLRNIYFQRRNHRMAHWAEFLTFMETMPHSWMFNYEGKNASTK